MDVNFKCIESIVYNYYESLYRYCFRMVRNKEDAEDMVQEVFMTINHLLSSKRKVNLHNNYLYRIAHNKCIDKIRKDKLIKFISFEGNNIENIKYEEDTYFKDKLNNELNEIMTLLKAEERSLLIFRIVYDMSYREISEIIGKTPSALRKQYERIRKKVIKTMREREGLGNERISII